MVKHIFALCALVFFAIVLSANAVPEPMSAEEVEQLGVISDIIEYIKEKLKATAVCIDDAVSTCTQKHPNKPIARNVCILDHLIRRKGECEDLETLKNLL